MFRVDRPAHATRAKGRPDSQPLGSQHSRILSLVFTKGTPPSGTARCEVQAHVVRFAPNRQPLKTQRGVGPIVGQTQESLSLLFGPSRGGPPLAISCVVMIFIDCGHGVPP